MESLTLCRHYLKGLAFIAINDTVQNTSINPKPDHRGIGNFYFSLMRVVVPLVCVLGVSGNTLNLVVLTRKRINNPYRQLERTANMGLTALAFSDLFFNLTVFPYAFIDKDVDFVAQKRVANLYYRVYGISFINVFLMVSTWLVVELALERYIILYHPLHAKCILGIKRTKIVIVAIFMTSLLATLPYFLTKTIVACQGEHRTFYEIRDRWSAESVVNDGMRFYQRWLWPFIAVFLPLCILMICNVRLVQGLRRVPRSRRRFHSPGQRIKESSNRITLTLIIIVFMSILLVTPAEVLKLINPYSRWGQAGLVAAALANLLQSINFAFNFILYCTIDAHFRRTCTHLFSINGCAKLSSLDSDANVSCDNVRLSRLNGKEQSTSQTVRTQNHLYK